MRSYVRSTAVLGSRLGCGLRARLQERQPEPAVPGCPLCRSLSWPTAIRAHCAVGLPSVLAELGPSPAVSPPRSPADHAASLTSVFPSPGRWSANRHTAVCPRGPPGRPGGLVPVMGALADVKAEEDAHVVDAVQPLVQNRAAMPSGVQPYARPRHADLPTAGCPARRLTARGDRRVPRRTPQPGLWTTGDSGRSDARSVFNGRHGRGIPQGRTARSGDSGVPRSRG